MSTKRPLNALGLWIIPELNRRNIRLMEFAELLHTTPQNLSDLLRGNRFRDHTLSQWEIRFREVLETIDSETREKLLPLVGYQVICSAIRNRETEDYTAYGLQCVCFSEGSWVLMDALLDISTCRETVIDMATRFNASRLSPLHFRDAVVDGLSEG